jgi:hypothetical protein
MSIGGGGYGDDETRTHLPEDPSGSGKPPASPARGVLTVVGIVVLLIAAIAFANRGSDSDSVADHNAGKNGGGSDSSPAPQPTAPTGKLPVLSGGEVPSHFPHNAQGAESAAANYVVALSGDGMFTTNKRNEIIKTVYDPTTARKRAGDLQKIYTDPKFLKKIGLRKDGTAPRGSTFVARSNPAGAKLLGYNDHKAKVSVWYSSLFGLAGKGSQNPVAESWFTNTFNLSWVGNDWKVTDFKQEDGPTPVGHDQAASSAQKMADAVKGYGGFTYAR